MNHENVQSRSVRDLVRGRRKNDWNLALVQRALVWDQVRIRYLLDSLLRGYPIGSLLLCRVTGQSQVSRSEAGPPADSEEGRTSWELLDGQQRINALFSMFTPDGHYGRFYLHMTVPLNTASGPVTARRARDQSVTYIHWQEESGVDTVMADRERHIDLSRFCAWAESPGRGGVAANSDGPTAADDAALDLKDSRSETVRILRAIDPDFVGPHDEREIDDAWHRLRRLLKVWLEPAIPVQYLALGDALDVLEVFTRINRAGVQVTGQDLFFAAVKTLWGEAEQTLTLVVDRLGPAVEERAQVTPLVGRMGALRILARLAARALGQADLMPLTVDRLSGVRGGAVIDVMRTLSDSGSITVQRMAATLNAVMQWSKLGFGLYSVDERLWDDVLGWASVNPCVDDAAWLKAQLPSIDGYLLGATAFRYPSVLRERFSRLAMVEALTAGLKEQAFPTQRIAEVARAVIPDLRDGRVHVRGLGEPEQLADANPSLFLSLLQSIPYRPQRDVFDWDHIFPQAQASKMWSCGPEGKWRRHHPHRHFVGSAGNFWGLDAGVNRAAQDRLPSEKFEHIERLLAEGDPRVWPRDRWWLTDDEIRVFGEVGRQLDVGVDIDEAMDRFQALVRGRARGMTEEVFRLQPEARLYAADEGEARAEPSPEPQIASALGVERPDAMPVPLGPEPSSEPDERVERVLRRGDTGPVLRDFVMCALRLGLQVRGYTLTITITPPTTRTVALVSMSPSTQQMGLVKTWVSPSAFARHFPEVSPELFDQALSGIRGSMLGSGEIRDLASRLEGLLSARSSTAGTGSAEIDSDQGQTASGG